MEKHADKGPLSESRSRGHARVKKLRHMKWTELSELTQLPDAFIGHARQRHDLTGCSETN